MKLNKTQSLLFLCLGCIFCLVFANKGFSEELPVKNKIKPIERVMTVEANPDITLKEAKNQKTDVDRELDDAILDDDFYEDNWQDEEVSDPLEPFNRLMWSINEKLFDFVLKPIASGYASIVPERFQYMVKNFFSNISAPVSLVSSILQGNKEKVDRTFMRFFINSSLGIGGLFDPAKSVFKIKRVNEDFDQVLGYYSVPFGPFIMLPILGPSTMRGIAGRSLQTFLSPEFLLGIGFLPAAGARSFEVINEVSLNLEQIDELTTFALDPYTSIKDFYIQRRRVLVNE